MIRAPAMGRDWVERVTLDGHCVAKLVAPSDDRAQARPLAQLAHCARERTLGFCAGIIRIALKEFTRVNI